MGGPLYIARRPLAKYKCRISKENEVWLNVVRDEISDSGNHIHEMKLLN